MKGADRGKPEYQTILPETGTEDEALLVTQILSGQRELFRLLIRRYQRQIHAMGLSFFRNREDAADFVQDVLLKCYRNLGSFKGRARFSTWLYRIAYNTAINSINRRREYQSLAEEPLAEENPETEILRKAAREAVKEAVAELPEKYRVCIDLFFFYDRSVREIEEITGFPENTVKSHVFRAKKLLRKNLSRDTV
ncbi:MAG: sigma-70 family RNA polymerase sigma factor [Spirochaetaceae bacterium]|jgi:RNA polymerase sigma-70 factor (ECF subfamily)|nr:sigma-70 family RNA polymerase sigma factor [Spirochaetaceae bacterium]